MSYTGCGRAPGYGMILWGFVFIRLGIKVSGIDIFPDVVGYLLVFKGLEVLVCKDVGFQKAKKLAGILIIMSAIGLVGQVLIGPAHITYVKNLLSNIPDAITVSWGFIEGVLELVMVWYIIGSIIVLASARGLGSLVKAATYLRNIYVGFQAIVYIIFPVLLKCIPSSAARMLIFPLAVLSLVIALLVMILIERAGRELGETPTAV